MIIRASDLRFEYRRGEPVLDGLSFEIGSPAREGRVVAVAGSSGSGKTTLLRLFAGLERPITGEIEFHPPLTRPPVYIFQEAVLLEQYSRLENARYRRMLRASRSHFEERLFDRLRRELRIDGSFLNGRRPLEAMSGGQRQRLALLRDLSVSPQLVLMDEPCVGLDPIVKLQFLQTLRSLVTEYRFLLLYVTHHADEVSLIADDLLMLSRPAEGRLPATVDVGCVAAQRRLPPSMDAAAMLSPQPLNVVSGRLEGERRFYLESRGRNDCARSSLVFGVDLVSHSAGCGGLPVHVAGASATYLCLEVVGSASTILATRRIVDDPTHVVVNGRGILYDENGRNPVLMSIGTTPVLSEQPCLSLTPCTF